ncbi:MAG: hypothetical protein IJ736_11925 [Firmicutes bacterium]|nr:hypothetical protein [Bacillota bacterium]
MTKSEILHQLYEECKEIEFNESSELIKCAKSDDERKFIKIVTDYVLQVKQRNAIAEKRF